jgi:signal transduction histidine kinase
MPAEAYGRPADSMEKKERASLHVELTADGRNVRFVVQDTGKGIPADEAEHIFEEFVQLDDYYDGTGIGLNVARSMARRLGGDIVLDTTYTAGARFVMTLKRD